MKRLIVCCDGTWNTPDQMDRGVQRPSNVVRMARMIRPQADDGVVQKVYYDRGVGTGDVIDQLFGGAFGIGLRHNILEAYEFLCSCHEPGDELWFFGFSRGAYTVRRVAGMLRKCGLPPAGLDERARKEAAVRAYNLFLQRETAAEGGADSPDAIALRQAFGSEPLAVHFIGVWDTVGAHGIGGVLGQFAGKTRFHDCVLSSSVRHARQALAIDEQRAAFRPTLWQQTARGVEKGQTLVQSWFAGAHSNIGGGYEDRGLSDITLHWMAAHAEQCALAFDPSWRTHLAPDVFGELRDSRSGLYKLLPAAPRVMGAHQYGGTEKIHQTPFERLQRDPAPYQPENLIACLQAGATRIDFDEPQP